MGIVTDYVIPAIVGAFISIFMDKIVVHYVKAALRSEKMLESLEEKVNAVIHHYRRFQEQSHYMCRTNGELQEFVRRASTMMQERRGLNVFSRYRRIKNITKLLISDVDIHLKLVPLIDLEVVLCQLVTKRRLHIASKYPSPAKRGRSLPKRGLVTSAIVGWVITSAFLVMFSWIKKLYNFNKKLESFNDLVHKINKIMVYIKPEIDVLDGGDDANGWLINARNWVEDMCDILREGKGIKDTRSPIARYINSKQITELTSKIDAHLNKLSWIHFEILIHEIERPPLETEGRTSHSTSPEETEGRTSHSTSPEETEGLTSQYPTLIQGDEPSSS